MNNLCSSTSSDGKVIGCHYLSFMSNKIGLISERPGKKFGLLGGKKSPKESLKQCLLRETVEELNMPFKESKAIYGRSKGPDSGNFYTSVSECQKYLCNYRISGPICGLNYVSVESMARGIENGTVEPYVMRVYTHYLRTTINLGFLVLDLILFNIFGSYPEMGLPEGTLYTLSEPYIQFRHLTIINKRMYQRFNNNLTEILPRRCLPLRFYLELSHGTGLGLGTLVRQTKVNMMIKPGSLSYLCKVPVDENHVKTLTDAVLTYGARYKIIISGVINDICTKSVTIQVKVPFKDDSEEDSNDVPQLSYDFDIDNHNFKRFWPKYQICCFDLVYDRYHWHDLNLTASRSNRYWAKIAKICQIEINPYNMCIIHSVFLYCTGNSSCEPDLNKIIDGLELTGKQVLKLMKLFNSISVGNAALDYSSFDRLIR